MDHALTLQGVTKRFGSFTAVSDLSLEVPKGCIYGFLGQNGAGKTTTIRMVMSIFHPDSGTISEESAIGDRGRMQLFPHHGLDGIAPERDHGASIA